MSVPHLRPAVVPAEVVEPLTAAIADPAADMDLHPTRVPGAGPLVAGPSEAIVPGELVAPARAGTA